MAKGLDGRKREGTKRREHICELLLEHSYVDVGELCAQLGANVSTIRRDLERLEAEGAVRRVHGGAYAHAAQTGVEIDFSLRLNFHTDAKRRIAHQAALLINNGDSVYLDAGTTALMVAEELVNRRSLDVVTNSLAAAEILRPAKGINLYVVGGRYLGHTRSLIGPMAEQGIRAFRFRKMILATGGIDYKNEVLTMSALEEIPIKRAAMAQSEQVILVIDRSKFGKPSLISMIPLANVHTLVTDAPPPEDAAAVFRNLHIEVITPQD
jgi:DeoR/GlpR family transcriptional regulator of sugar metabolism